MTEHEQAKAALAALAEREPERSGRGGTDDRAGPDESTTEPTEPSSHPTAGDQPTQAAADYRAVIERAVAATDDLDAAAEFVESVGLDGLETAVERAEREVSGLAAEGREALVTFERFRVAAAGPVDE